MRLETPRLLLRAFEDDDWQPVLEYAAHPQALRYMPGDPPDAAAARSLVRWMQAGPTDSPPHDDFAIVHRAEQRVIGWCGLGIRYDEQDQGELAYALHPDFWGAGYATEAARAVLAYGFSERSLHRIYATCRPENAGSWRVLEKVGLRREGHLRRHRWIRGAWHDSYLYAILDEEWNARG